MAERITENTRPILNETSIGPSQQHCADVLGFSLDMQDPGGAVLRMGRPLWARRIDPSPRSR